MRIFTGDGYARDRKIARLRRERRCVASRGETNNFEAIRASSLEVANDFQRAASNGASGAENEQAAWGHDRSTMRLLSKQQRAFNE